MNEDAVLRLKEALKKRAAKKFPKNKTRQNAYIFGPLRNTGWKPQREREQ